MKNKMDKSRLRVLNPQIENSEPLQFKGKRKGCEFSTFSLVHCPNTRAKGSPFTSIQTDTILQLCTNTTCSLDKKLDETKSNGQANKKNIFHRLDILQWKTPTGLLPLPFPVGEI